MLSVTNTVGAYVRNHPPWNQFKTAVSGELLMKGIKGFLPWTSDLDSIAHASDK